MGCFREDKERSDLAIPYLKSIVGRVFVDVATIEADMRENTDLVILGGGKAPTVACRTRNEHYERRYPFDITIRSKRYSGRETEFEKMMAGFGDALLYAFVLDTGKPIRWVMTDLKKFRYAVSLAYRDRCFHEIAKEHANADRSSDFYSFDIRHERLRCTVIGASHGYWEAVAA